MTLYTIWDKRRKLLNNKTWKGDDPVSCFNLDKLDSNKNLNQLPFSSDNWNDLSISDFRSILDDLRHYVYPERLNKKDYNLTEIDVEPIGLTILSNPKHDLTMIYSSNMDQHSVNIRLDTSQYFLTWYKNRGRLEVFNNSVTGKPITLYEMTELLVALELEKPFEN